MIKKITTFLTFFTVFIGLQGMEPANLALKPEVFPLQALIAVNERPEAKLKKLNMIANFLVLQAESYTSLKNMIPLFEELHKLQPYRVIDQEGKEFLSAFRLTFDENDERYSKFENEHGRPINQINVYAPEAQALAFQLIPLFSDWKLKKVSQAHLIDKYLNHENENIRAVAGLVKHMVYSMQLAHVIFACPSALLQFNGVILANNMASEFPPFFKFDEQIFAKIMQLACMKDIIFCTAQLIGDYQKSGQYDDVFEIFVDSDCLSHIAQAKNVCKAFEAHIPKFQKLYDDVRCAIAATILKASRDSAIKQQLRNEYYGRIFGIFNTNPSCQPERPLELRKYFTSPKELPVSLEYKVKQLALLNGPIKSDVSRSFLPVSLSKSAPAPSLCNKVAGKKKKNKSYPVSRPASPSCVPSSGSESSPEESKTPEKISKPVLIQPKVLAAALIRYDERVLDWFDPETIKEHILYASRESVEYHCFTRLVDGYLFKFGIQTPWENKTRKGNIDTNYSLGGMIERSGQERQNVVFTCCKDNNGVCYHRGFEQNDELFNQYFCENQWKVLHRDEFPQLGQPHRAPFAARGSKDEDKVLAEDDLCVKIRDGHLDMNIVLYKPNLN